MLQSKAGREKQKLITDKCQSLIEVMLKDEDNKYCVDCDAKGPRWVSWNLGIFLCIRCAGIHRNLGVHISKVKSVNLDAWTPEHVAYVQRMGNSRARAIYEANLPDDFRRPQTDTALESFIRAKYEHKKYIAQDYVDPGPPEPAFNIDEELKKMKEQKRSKVTAIGGITRMISVTELPSNPKPRPKEKEKENSELVDLDSSTPTEVVSKSSKNDLDLLIGVDMGTTEPVLIAETANKSSKNALDLLIGPNLDTTDSTVDSAKKVLTKESILSLYSISPSTNALGTDPFGLSTSTDFLKPANTSTGNSNTVNSSLDELFGGLNILQPKPS